MNPYRLVRPLVYRIDAEATHDGVLRALNRLGRSQRGLELAQRVERFESLRLNIDLFGHRLTSPLAVAAGLDKAGVAVPAFGAFGFGYVEVGTVTLHPQPGNPKPRVFRLTADQAVINRMGFPSPGMEQVAANLATGTHGRFAINVGPNKDRIEHAAEDCLAVIERFAPMNPLYAVVNVSSPNTARLRDLQGKQALTALLSAVRDGRSARAQQPLLVKIAPDLTDAELDDILSVVTELGLPGIVATNTSVSRPDNLSSGLRGETGGLSGRPIRERSTRMIARIREVTGGTVTIIAAGGVFDGADALDKVGAGATIVQTYTGLIYQGPGMGKQVKQQMARIMERQGIASLDQIRGTGYRAPRN